VRGLPRRCPSSEGREGGALLSFYNKERPGTPHQALDTTKLPGAEVLLEGKSSRGSAGTIGRRKRHSFSLARPPSGPGEGCCAGEGEKKNALEGQGAEEATWDEAESSGGLELRGKGIFTFFV